MFESNCRIGSFLESFVANVVNEIYDIVPHNVWNKGLDLETVNGELACEMINWHSGFIHPLRFKSIVDNLVTLGSKAKFKLFICAGVKPTSYQYKLLMSYGIKVVLLPNMKQSSLWLYFLLKSLIESGVITFYTLTIPYTTFTIPITMFTTFNGSSSVFSDCLPVSVVVADDVDGSNPHSVWSFRMLNEMRSNPDTGWFD